MTTPTNASAYKPGDCNINDDEINRRRIAGYIGLCMFGIGLGATIFFTTLIWWRLLLWFPAYLAAIGLLQVHYKFCVAYGSSGRQNAEPGSKQAHTVTSELALQKDRYRARIIHLQAGAIASTATVLTVLLPTLNK